MSASERDVELRPRGWRVWTVPLIAAVAYAAVVASDTNLTLLHVLNSFGPATSDALWACLNALGDAAAALTLCLPLWRRRRDVVGALLVGALIAAGWVHMLKPLISEPRPPAVLPSTALHVIGPAYKSNSFPSGHATTTFAVAGIWALGLGLRRAYIPLVLCATVVAFSRCVAGVHWPLDVLAGIFGGWLSAAFGLIVAEHLHFRLRPWVQWSSGLVMIGCAVALLVGYGTGYSQALGCNRDSR